MADLMESLFEASVEEGEIAFLRFFYEQAAYSTIRMTDEGYRTIMEDFEHRFGKQVPSKFRDTYIDEPEPAAEEPAGE